MRVAHNAGVVIRHPDALGDVGDDFLGCRRRHRQDGRTGIEQFMHGVQRLVIGPEGIGKNGGAVGFVRDHKRDVGVP